MTAKQFVTKNYPKIVYFLLNKEKNNKIDDLHTLTGKN